MKKVLNTAFDYFQSKPIRIKWVVILFILQFCIYGYLGRYTNTAHFGGDTWEYQSMAVNLLNGYGFPVFGGILPIEEYKFDNSNPELISSFKKGAGNYNFYRTPAYPIFLAGIYSIFGVNPIVAKFVQLGIILSVSIITAWIGYLIWSVPGYVAGLIGGVFFNIFNTYPAQFILTEPLIALAVALIVLIFLTYTSQPNWLWAAVLGISLGLGLLVKGVLIFIPFLVGLFEFVTCVKERNIKRFWLLVIIILATIFTIAPWSYLASRKSERFIFLSTQGKLILLDNNNENSIDGKWHPEWISDENSFYNKDGLKEKATWIRVSNFYIQNPHLIIPILVAKLKGAFYPIAFLWVIVLIYILFFIEKIININLIYKISIIILLLLLISGAFYSHLSTFLYPVYTLILIIFLLLLFWNRNISAEIKIPSILWIVFLNFILVSIITSVDDYLSMKSRFVRGMEFLFNLTAFYLLISFILKSKMFIHSRNGQSEN